ncbi:Inner membrane transport protein YeaN [compost metagenome]
MTKRNHTDLNDFRSNAISTKTAAPMVLIVAIFLTAAALRSPITGVGSLIVDIQNSTGLSHTLAGMLTTLPLIAFALLALAAPKLSSRFGLEFTLMYSMVILTAGIIIRSLPSVFALFIGTALIGSAIAICNVLVPGLIKRDFSNRLGLMTALYTSSMNLWAAVASGISVPLSRTVVGWRGSLAFWVILSSITALCWLPILKQIRNQHAVNRGSNTLNTNSAQKTANISSYQSTGHNHSSHEHSSYDHSNPNRVGSGNTSISNVTLQKQPKESKPRSIWRSSVAWQVTIFMGLQSIMFYVGVSWLPEILHQQGMSPDLAGWMLSLMQMAGMIGSFVMPLIAARTQNQKYLTAASSSLFLLGFGGIWLGGTALAPLFITLIGFGCGTTFSLVIVFFALRTQSSEEAAQLSGMAQSIGYLLAAVGPTLFGFLHDQSGNWSLPLAVMTCLTLVTIILGFLAGRKGYVNPGGNQV